jgi:hypothetical protein
MMPPEEWPDYRVGNRDYIHALGVIASVFNLLEFRFRSLFPIYTRIPSPPAYVLFGKINNEMRMELIRGSLEFSSHPEAIKDDVRYFLDGFKICAENRNILMHSTVFYLFGPDNDPCPVVTSPPGAQPERLGFQKAPKSKPFQINTYQLSIKEIRAQADSIKAFEVYGDRLYWHILKDYEPASYGTWNFPEEAQFALPKRPPLPNPLIALPPDTERE